ncbi:glycosyltransferase family 2 protein [Denitromonas iodatirespirans]|uniref:Glycosyltransferase family 2 protein n=1 Tax=Denitromonas iodatirespirans TaxID=2795389 RepID=A0A944D5Y9_DENI1|nr:glycosyltransferase family 2 protein [Denitromonas iodatirespirans]MBT0960585.1 glycosyltransferase family 2 protein [Denitromonas iodatirespirans]
MLEISVAIATYNRAHLIGETIGAILAQALPPTEIVIVDDGSSDDSERVIKAIDGPIRYHRIDNVGPGAALKTAIELCRSDWIAMCDDDDQWFPNHLSRKAALLERHPDAEFLFANFSSFGDAAIEGFHAWDDIPAGWWDGLPAADADGFRYFGPDQLARFLDYNPVFPTAAMMSRRLYERSGGIDPVFSRLGCWDAHMTWRCVLHGAVASDDTITASTRRHAGNFSRQRSRVNIERASMLDRARQDGWIPAKYHVALERAIAASRVDAASWAWLEHDYRTMREQLARVPAAQIDRNLRLKAMIARLPAALVNRLRAPDTSGKGAA